MSETRKIAAILVADVVGYSRLAGADEDRTLARLRGLRRDLIDPAIAVHHGRVVKRTGDKRRLLRRHHRQIGGLESLAVDHAEIALDRRSHPLARAEGLTLYEIERLFSYFNWLQLQEI